jgi:DNA-binding transcriptional ArsR family regulator
MTAYLRIIDALRANGSNVIENGSKAQAQCPAHDDGRASLSIGHRRDGKGTVVYCHAGCDPYDIVANIGWTMRELFDDDQMRAAYNVRNVYDYPDGRKVHRDPPKKFRQSGNTKGTALFHADRISDTTTSVYIPEGEKDVLAIEAVGGVAVCSAMGAGKADKFDWTPLAGRHAIVVADNDEPGRKHAAQVAELLTNIAASVAIKQAAAGKDIADHIAAGHTLDELLDYHDKDSTPAVEPVSLEKAHDVFQHWFGDDYDTDALDAELATAAVEEFNDGSDPIWLLIISGPGAAKTETVQALDGVGATITSSISSEAALLSGTPKRERAKTATGGLLRRIGDRGLLVIKDVTSILSMDRNTRAKVLAALREIYDGRWSRELGTDGGRIIEWRGRIVVVGAVTTAWDTAHAVITAMGDRFVLVRIDSTKGRHAAGRKAIGNTGDETRMRAELAAAVGGVIAGMNREPITVTDAETDILLAAADLTTRSRTAVEYDYRGDVIDTHAPEMPTRFAKQLAQIIRGAVAIGMDRADALRLAIRCARDSMPPLRLAIIDDLAEHPCSTATDVRRRLDKPRATADRQLQALHILGIVDVEECEDSVSRKSRWYYSLADDVDPDALKPKPSPEMLVDVSRLIEREGEIEDREGGNSPCSHISGDGPPSAANTAYLNGLCRDCHDKPHSAGRPRCDTCHKIWQTTVAGYDQ